jgi:hypothetical protein
VRQSPVRAHSGESSVACLPTRCSRSLSVPSSPGFFDSAEPLWTSHTVAKM